jgi:hypothetical protein
MKKILYAIFISLFLYTGLLSAQSSKLRYADYDWDKNPVLTNTTADTSNSSVMIFNKAFNEYVYEDNQLYQYKLSHIRIKLITSSGIEKNNKVYIPVGETDKEIIGKARVIKNDGTVKELGKEEIKEGFDKESQQKYHYFAFEGIETGCEIEYIFYIRKNPVLSGSFFNVQYDYPVMHTEYNFITPLNLYFKFKSYNGCPDLKRDTSEKENNVWRMTKDSIPRLKDEESAALSANTMRFCVKLDKNSGTGKKDIYSYGEVSSGFYDRIYNSLDSKDTKLIKALIKEIKPDESSQEATIRSVENYLKTNFIYYKTDDYTKEMPILIIQNKAFNDIGAMKMYANIFNILNIEHEIVITCSRYDQQFDKDFESYAFLNDYMIYFPKIKKYMSPADNFTRLGFPDFKNVNNNGLFIKGISMGEYNTGLGKIKFINGASCNESYDILKITADIDAGFQDTKYNVYREMTGYTAYSYQPFFEFIKDADDLKEFSESIIKYIDSEGAIENLEFENKGANNFGVKPFIAKATLKSDYFFEKAGTKYLFKAGMLIGPQAEMYKKEKRYMPLDIAYPHGYKRTIEFNIPEGYKVSNLDQLKINETYTRNGSDTTMAFVSDYTTEGNKITISVLEYYKEYQYALSEFEEYRRVANASANFNKVVLVFEKKN